MEQNTAASIVVGSGIAGLTQALLLARQGKRVIIVEDLPFIGGYLNRFTRNNIRFDTGFHFTGGFDHILPQVLQELGLTDFIQPVPLKEFDYFADTRQLFQLPNSSIDALQDYLCTQFPDDAAAIRAFYQAERETIQDTVLQDLSNNGKLTMAQLSPYDTCTVNEFFDQLGIHNRILRSLLAIQSFCHGTPPAVASLSYHCRCSYNLDTGLMQVRNGGDAFIAAFKHAFKSHDVTIRTRTCLQRVLIDDDTQLATGVVLSSGESIPASEIYFAISPRAFLPLFPDGCFSGNHVRRIRRLQPTCSFFTLYACLDAPIEPNITLSLTSSDMDAILSPHSNEHGTGMVFSRTADLSGAPVTTITAFRTMFIEDVWAELGVNETDDYSTLPQYRAFKQRIAQDILQEILTIYPEYDGKITIAATASPLTCRRFSPPIGSAYGTQQRLGESRLAGRLPIRNTYAIGHHAQFPGILGCMLGAFMVNN